MVVAVVAEKPSVGRDIASVLGATQRGNGTLSGNGYVVTWAIGHLVGLAEPEGVRPEWKRWRRADLPLLPERWPLAVFDSTREQFEIVRRVLRARDVESVICATDAGREGELIFRFIYEAAECKKPVSRLWISSLTESAIREGLRRLRPARDYDNLADAALGRSRADWLVGMNLSRAYGLSLDAPLSVGRVQTPTLAMLVARELEIRHFVPEDYLEIRADFSGAQGERYRGTWFDPERKEHPSRLPADGERATRIVERVKRGLASVASVTSESKRLPPPQLYDLTELQRHANRLFGFSAQRTLDVAQALYEKHKLVSYPRTDSRALSSEAAAELPAVIAAIRAPYADKLAPGTGERPLSRRFVDDSKVGDHHAIIPTSVPAGSRALSGDERRLYDLICRRLLQAFHDDCVWAATKVITEVRPPDTQEPVERFRSHGTTIERPGWKVLDLGPIAAPQEKRGKPAADALPPEALPSGLTRGQALVVDDARALKKTTRPPPSLNDATLLTAMETAGKTLDEKELSDAMRDSGLGTPATRASIIETLLSRGFARRDGQSLRATERGIGLIEVVDRDVKSAAMTGAWEARLQAIARGQGRLAEFLKQIEAYVIEVVARVPPSLPPLPGDEALPARGPSLTSTATRPAPQTHAAASPRARSAPASVAPLGSCPGGGGTQLLPSKSRALRASPPRGGSADSDGPVFHTSPLGATQSRAPGIEPAVEAAPRLSDKSSAPEAPPTETHAPRPQPLDQLLRDRFGFAEFRPHQRAVCEAASQGRDLLLVMPTGAGKSLCYQLPGLARGGTTLVVSPLIALMEDQVGALRGRGLSAERIHSGRPRLESRQVCTDYLAGRLDFLFIAPERLGVPGFTELLGRRPLGLIAIDEAHCISQWGHDFRPDYRLLGERLPGLRPAPIVALTATATPRVQRDIIAQLRLSKDAQRFIHGFRRHNLALEALELAPKERPARALQWLSGPGRLPAIVYAPTRKAAESLAQVLSLKFRAQGYHAGMPAERRERVQSEFLSGRIDVVVATVAFGMGVDKPDIRTVLHLALPSSVEGYYQEIGRAGRDGLPSRAVLMHHAGDQKTHRFFFERDYPDPSVLEKIFAALEATPVSAQTLRKKTRINKADFEKALEKLGLHGGVRSVAEDQLVRGHEGFREGYAAQRALRTEQLAAMARFAQGSKCRMLALVEHFGDQHDSGAACGQCDVCIPAASLKKQAIAPALSSLASSSLSRPKRAGETSTKRGRRAARPSGVALPAAGPSAGLVAMLRAWRLTEAKKKRVPAFRILTNRALVSIAEARPRSPAELERVVGVGPKLLSKYGRQLLVLCGRG